MSRFVTSNSAYGNYIRSGSSQMKPVSSTAMQIEKPLHN
jgi:hypothetical protein